MSLEQVNAFYEVVSTDANIYEQYYSTCCQRGMFGAWNWDTNKIVSFANSLGFNFTESELVAVLFDSDATLTSVTSTDSGRSYPDYSPQPLSHYAY